MADSLPAGTVKISTDMLEKFAGSELSDFLDDLRSNSGVTDMKTFADDSGSGGMNGHYSRVLPGNTADGKMASVSELQSGFHDLASMITESMTTLKDQGAQLQMDLKEVSSIVTDAGDQANITAQQLQTDLANMSLTGGGTTAAATTGDTST